MNDMLDGLRVADLSIVTAGAGATQVLADFGADVVKIEGVDRPDMYRGGLRGDQGGHDLSAPPFRTANRNKRALAVDLKTPEGLEVVRKLVAESDVVVENFRRGVIERLGLGFRDLVAVRPDIVLVSISSQGATGPNSGFTSFGTTLDALGGIMSLSGYDEDTPTWSSGRINYPDQTANSLSPAVILAAVMAARHDGRARWVDLSQREAVTSLLGEHILATSLGAPDPIPVGNDGRGSTEWLTRCAGEDHWVAVTATTDEQRDVLARVVGVDAAGTAAELRAATERWSSDRSREEVTQALQDARIAAAPVTSGEELLDDPFLQKRGWWQTVEGVDAETEQQRGFVVRFDEGGPAGVRRRAPRIGEHSRDVLAELGYDAEQIQALHDSGVVASPTPATATS